MNKNILLNNYNKRQRYSELMLSKKKQNIFSRAMNEAEKSDMLFKHGCVATCGGKVIAVGHNSHKGSTKTDLFLNDQCSYHAEINVLKQIYFKNKSHKINKIMRKTTLYVSRSSKTHQSVNSAPCEKCMRYIRRFNIRKLIFSMDEEMHVYNARDYFTDHKTFGDITLTERLQKENDISQSNKKTNIQNKKNK